MISNILILQDKMKSYIKNWFLVYMYIICIEWDNKFFKEKMIVILYIHLFINLWKMRQRKYFIIIKNTKYFYKD